MYFGASNYYVTMNVLLQNHPNDRVFPVRVKWSYFQKTKDSHRLLYLVATLAFVIALMTALGLFFMYKEQNKPQPQYPQYPNQYYHPVVPNRPSPLPAAISFVLSTAAFILIARYLCAVPKNEQLTYYKNSGATVLSEEKRQALRLHLVDIYESGFWSETLEYYPLAANKGNYKYTYLNPAPADTYRKSLDKDWSILGADDYHAVADRLLTDGYHSKSFAINLHLRNDQGLSRRLAGLTGLPEAYILSCLEPGANGRPPRLLWAFEFWRAIVVARNAYMAGYITEAEAWKDILRGAELSYEVFENFEDFCDNFRLGNAYWSDSLEITKDRADGYRHFKANCNWPLVNLPWPARKGLVLPTAVGSAYASEVAQARTTIGQHGSLN